MNKFFLCKFPYEDFLYRKVNSLLNTIISIFPYIRDMFCMVALFCNKQCCRMITSESQIFDDKMSYRIVTVLKSYRVLKARAASLP